MSHNQRRLDRDRYASKSPREKCLRSTCFKSGTKVRCTLGQNTLHVVMNKRSRQDEARPTPQIMTESHRKVGDSFDFRPTLNRRQLTWTSGSRPRISSAFQENPLAVGTTIPILNVRNGCGQNKSPCRVQTAR